MTSISGKCAVNKCICTHEHDAVRVAANQSESDLTAHTDNNIISKK